MSRRRNHLTADARTGRVHVYKDFDELWATAADIAFEDPYDWWDDEIPTHPGYTWAHWQTAFADITLDVCRRVWSKTGAHLYATHRDTLLRDDLQDWLVVEAQKIANQYIPNQHAEDPGRYWGAYLWTALHTHARYHFAAVVGRDDRPSGQAAREAHARGIKQASVLDEQEAETGRVTNRYALHGQPYGTEDPLSIIIRLEQLEQDIALAERAPRDIRATEWGGASVYTTSSYDKHGPCATLGCPNPVHLRGLCRTCYERDRVQWANTKGYVCKVPDCGKTHKGHGFCAGHLLQHKEGRLPEEYLHLYEESRPRGGGKRGAVTCTHDGCDRPARSRSLCHKHYMAARREAMGTCSADGCEKKVLARGMCPMHYQRARKTGELQ